MKRFTALKIAAAAVIVFATLVFTVAPTNVRALQNGLALTPPMGWNSWNKFGCKIDEKAVREMADAMVASGMRDAGYQFIVIDDCWQVDRDSKGNIVSDGKAFPSGIRALADYVHAKGLKFGIYSDAGTKTCAGRPGSWGYEFQDARQYAEWGVDYLKYDWCNNGGQNSEAAYSRMRDALAASGRPIVFSICEWGDTKPWLWARNIGNLWRTTGDIQDIWEGKKDSGDLGVIQIIDLQDGLEAYSGPGHWNDPDMLEVGNGGMTDTEYRTHFSFWCLLAAPLMAGNDLRSMKPATRDILTNKEVIAVNQDPLGKQASRVRDEGDLEVWARPLADGTRAVIMLNRGPKEAQVTVNWADIGYPGTLDAKVRDLWQHQDRGIFKGSYTAPVAGHGVVMIRITP
ncbi:MAG: alpha-galactosidase [Candidatus Aminicenantales bacterium]